MKTEKRHALTNTYSVNRVSHSSVIEPIALHKFTSYSTSISTQRPVHSNHNTIIQTSVPSKLTIS